MAGLDGIFGLLDQLNGKTPTVGNSIQQNPATMPTTSPQTVAQTPQDQWRRMMMARMLMNNSQPQQATTPAQSLANGLGQMGNAWWMNRMMHPDTANQPGGQNPTQPQTPTGVMPMQGGTGPNSSAVTPLGLPVSLGPLNIPFGMGGQSSLMDTKGIY